MKSTDDESTVMDLERFEVLLDAYGAEPDRWPDDERAPAAALLERSEAARALLEGAAELDALLGEVPDEAPSAQLRRQVLAAAPAPPQSWLERLDRLTERLWPFTPRWQPASALVAAAILGLVAGAQLPDAGVESETVDVAELAFGSEADWEGTDGSEMP